MIDPDATPYDLLDAAIAAATTGPDKLAPDDGAAALVAMFYAGRTGAANALGMALGSAVPALRHSAWGATRARAEACWLRRAANETRLQALRAELAQAQAIIDRLDEQIRLDGDLARLDALSLAFTQFSALDDEIRHMGDYVEHHHGEAVRGR